ncbi:MAG: aminodeoxychorismate synthase component I [Desulfobulbaceae bacterium]|nr:aminodeoxychorismate synthase component I [Desulfobulbaceae bacterium]
MPPVKNNVLQQLTPAQLQGVMQYLDGVADCAFFETTRCSKENHSSYLFLAPLCRLQCRCGDDPLHYLEQIQTWVGQGYYVAGWLAYEFGYLLESVLARQIGTGGAELLADFAVYQSPLIYDHASGSFSKGSGWPLSAAQAGPEWTCRIDNLRFSQERQEYLVQVARIKEYIAAGDTYQVNYTLKLLFDCIGNDGALYEILRRNQSVAYGAYLKSGSRRIMSFSPELFFRQQGRECWVRPMKGTSKRGYCLDEDRQVGDRLAGDPKNRSENVMIVDLLRNDLGRLCEMGSVETLSLFDVETYETLHQMTSTIKGQLRADITLVELFQALFPCGSVTGAPKIRTMEIIRELEGEDRGVYTGAIGFIGPDESAVFNVPIRTVVLEAGQGKMGIGSGIVFDSDGEAEWRECLLKARFLQAPAPDFQLFETILWQPGQGFWLLDLHLERLRKSAAYWGFPFPAELLLRRLDAAIAAAAGDDSCCLRVRLVLGKDGLATVTTAVCACPQALDLAIGCADVGLPLVKLAGVATDPEDPFLYHKTTRRQLYEAERKQAEEAGCFEVLFVNRRGELSEGSFTNLFLLRGEELLTPPVSSGLLNGVLRGALLDGRLSLPRGLVVREEVLRPGDLAAAEIFVGNSLRGLRRVALAPFCI